MCHITVHCKASEPTISVRCLSPAPGWTKWFCHLSQATALASPALRQPQLQTHSCRLSVLGWQATVLPILCYSDTGSASTHSSRLSSFALLPKYYSFTWKPQFYFGIRGVPLQLFSNNLLNRKQHVTNRNMKCCSKIFLVECHKNPF